MIYLFYDVAYKKLDKKLNQWTDGVINDADILLHLPDAVDGEDTDSVFVMLITEIRTSR
jgi:hypothetical protein